jgi:hypothetical protein
MNIAFRRTQRGKREYGFIVKAWPKRWKPEAGSRSLAVNSYLSREDIHADQTLVLSDDIKLVKGEEVVIPARVRLQGFDDLSFALSEPLFVFASVYSSNGVHDVVGIFPDWKVHVSSRCFAVAPGKGCTQQIEAAADAIQNGPDFRVDNRGKSLHIIENEKHSFSVRIALFNNSIGFACREGLDSFMQYLHLG